MKPSWGDAPEWANWLAMDLDGDWFWFEDEPSKSNWRWRSYGRSQYAGNNDWVDSKEPRP